MNVTQEADRRIASRRRLRHVAVLGLVLAGALAPVSVSAAAGPERQSPFADFKAAADDQYGPNNNHHNNNNNDNNGNGNNDNGNNGNGNDNNSLVAGLPANTPAGPLGPEPVGGEAPTGGGGVPVSPAGGVRPLGPAGVAKLPFTGLDLLLLLLIGLLLIAAGTLLRAAERGWRRARLARLG